MKTNGNGLSHISISFHWQSTDQLLTFPVNSVIELIIESYLEEDSFGGQPQVCFFMCTFRASIENLLSPRLVRRWSVRRDNRSLAMVAYQNRLTLVFCRILIEVCNRSEHQETAFLTNLNFTLQWYRVLYRLVCSHSVHRCSVSIPSRSVFEILPNYIANVN